MMFFIIVFLIVPFSCFAMNDFERVQYSEPIQEKIANAPIEISLSGQMIYIADESELKKIEKMYGEVFPANTIFVSIRWIFPENENGVNNDKDIPAYIPYEYIESAKEEGIINILLGRKKCEVLCKQHRRNNHYFGTPFHILLERQLKQFASHVNYFPEDEESLAKNKIIDLSKYGSSHGDNKSFYVARLKEALL